ncbi:MAG: DNA repair protein RecO [Longimicrobiales bacterium]|nr:DNA repair protein RecO [Longimicrobiales bacterium]
MSASTGPVRTRAILLRTHDYSETSRIHRYFTEAYGLVSVMARGIRARSAKGGASAGLFDEVDLQMHLRAGRDLQTLRDVTLVQGRPGLARTPVALSAAGVLGEIVLRHHGEEESSELFARLRHALDRLAETRAEGVSGVLLAEGWGLVSTLGFRPHLTHCVLCGTRIGAEEMARLDHHAGGVRCLAAGCGEGFSGPRVGPGARAQVEAFVEGVVPDPLEHARAHLRLFSEFVTIHVVPGRPLEAFKVLAALLPPDEARA